MMTKAEVGPADFVKVRLLGKGDVGKVYLVKRKDTGKLYAMKGSLQGVGRVLKRFVRQLLVYSALEKRNDQTE
jgi:serine/threonine protein kinase